MTAETVITMLAIPLGIMGIIAFVVLAGPLRPEVRRWLEWVMIGAFYPGMTLYFAWRTAHLATEAEWISAALSVAVVVLMAVQGFVLVHKQVRADGTRT